MRKSDGVKVDHEKKINGLKVVTSSNVLSGR